MNAKSSKSKGPSPQPDRAASRRHRRPTESETEPAGVQGANTGYWQAVGSTRTAAKRSKRP